MVLDLSKSESSFQENIEPSMHYNHQNEAQQLSHNIIICTNTSEQREKSWIQEKNSVNNLKQHSSQPNRKISLS